jgi:hypothetical protein
MAKNDTPPTPDEIDAAAERFAAVLSRIPGPSELGRGNAEAHLRTTVQWAKRAISDYHPEIERQADLLAQRDQEIADLRAQLAAQPEA